MALEGGPDYNRSIDAAQNAAQETTEDPEHTQLMDTVYYIIRAEDGKDLVREHYQGEPERAEDVAQIAEDTGDPTLLISYLNSFNGEISNEGAAALNDTAHILFAGLGQNAGPDRRTCL